MRSVLKLLDLRCHLFHLKLRLLTDSLVFLGGLLFLPNQFLVLFELRGGTSLQVVVLLRFLLMASFQRLPTALYLNQTRLQLPKRSLILLRELTP